MQHPALFYFTSDETHSEKYSFSQREHKFNAVNDVFQFWSQLLVLTCGSLNLVSLTFDFFDDCVHLDNVGDPGSHSCDEVGGVCVGNLNLGYNESKQRCFIHPLFYILIDMTKKEKKLPGSGNCHHPFHNISKCNTLPHERTPTQPRERHQSPGPIADPEGQRLKDKERRRCRERHRVNT